MLISHICAAAVAGHALGRREKRSYNRSTGEMSLAITVAVAVVADAIAHPLQPWADRNSS
jgi:dolichol kinase